MNMKKPEKKTLSLTQTVTDIYIDGKAYEVLRGDYNRGANGDLVLRTGKNENQLEFLASEVNKDFAIAAAIEDAGIGLHGTFTLQAYHPREDDCEERAIFFPASEVLEYPASDASNGTRLMDIRIEGVQCPELDGYLLQQDPTPEQRGSATLFLTPATGTSKSLDQLMQEAGGGRHMYTVSARSTNNPSEGIRGTFVVIELTHGNEAAQKMTLEATKKPERAYFAYPTTPNGTPQMVPGTAMKLTDVTAEGMDLDESISVFYVPIERDPNSYADNDAHGEGYLYFQRERAKRTDDWMHGVLSLVEKYEELLPHKPLVFDLTGIRADKPYISFAFDCVLKDYTPGAVEVVTFEIREVSQHLDREYMPTARAELTYDELELMSAALFMLSEDRHYTDGEDAAKHLRNRIEEIRNGLLR
jgi:hypothetical protein